MSFKAKREIECLLRLQTLTGQLEEILYFLRSEDLITDSLVKTTKHSSNMPKDVQQILQDVQLTNKVQMLTYEWSVLPVENIIITIITDRAQKLFEYNG